MAGGMWLDAVGLRLGKRRGFRGLQTAHEPVERNNYLAVTLTVEEAVLPAAS